MGNWLGLGAVNAGMLWGLLLIGVPILIHILNRRRYRTVRWAAMDFLLDAQRRNRRRVRMEDMILLLLRCLAMVLLALLVARLTLQPRGLSAAALPRVSYARIVILDDSPSTDARRGAQTVFDAAKAETLAVLRRAAARGAGDTFTLLLTSAPKRPVFDGQVVTEKTAVSLSEVVGRLTVSDRAADLSEALLAAEALTGREGEINHHVTIVTDFLDRDWTPPAGSPPERAIPGILQRLADKAPVDIVRVRGDSAENAGITDLRIPEDVPAAGVSVRFEAVVRNFGAKPVADGALTVTVGDNVPQRADIRALGPGESRTVSFAFVMPQPDAVPVRAELSADSFNRDNTRHFAADVREGVRVLLVDGLPGTSPGQSETYFLRRAIRPPGPVTSGNLVDTVGVNEFQNKSLDPYDVVALANVYRIGDERRTALEAWVRAGGGVLVFLGDQVDPDAYNAWTTDKGEPWLPVRLTAPAGDVAAREWVSLSIRAESHPVLRVFRGQESSFLQRVKVFRWWETVVPPLALTEGRAEVLAVYTDKGASPAMVEASRGEGRILAITTSAGMKWNAWPPEASYVVAMQEAVRRLRRPWARETALRVGEPLVARYDPAVFNGQVRVSPPPPGAALAIRARTDEAAKALVLTYEETDRAGLYRVEADRHEGAPVARLFAVNLDSAEGDLRPASEEPLGTALAGGRVSIRDAGEGDRRDPTDGRAELWRGLLMALVVALCVEQGLGWWFGTRRRGAETERSARPAPGVSRSGP